MALYCYAGPFIMDRLGCPETSVITKSTPLKVREKRRSNFHCGGSVKSRMFQQLLFPCYDAGGEFSLVRELKTSAARTKDVIPLRDVYHAALLLNNFCLFSVCLIHSIHVFFSPTTAQ